jgi:phage terminase large subunit GpA-like protein
MGSVGSSRRYWVVGWRGFLVITYINKDSFLVSRVFMVMGNQVGIGRLLYKVVGYFVFCKQFGGPG